MTVPAGWRAGGGERRDIVDLFSVSSPTASLSVTTLENPIDPGDVTGERTIAQKNLLRFLHDHPRLNTGPIARTTIGGRRASSFTFSVDDAKLLDLPPCGGTGCIAIGSLSDGGGFGFSRARPEG